MKKIDVRCKMSDARLRYIALVLVSLSLCFAQGKWVVQDNPYNGDEDVTFSDVCAVDSLHVWVVGGPTHLHTTDGGKTWEEQRPMLNMLKRHIMNYLDYGSVEALDSLHCYIAWGSQVHLTSDGGKTWSVIQFPMYTGLCDIELTDTLKGWVVGRRYEQDVSGYRLTSLIYHSKNGGKDWILQDSASFPALYGVCFIDSLKGFAVGDSGVIVRTLDGGEHWERIESPTTNWLRDIQFADSLHGIVVTRGNALRTTDGGETWVEVQGGAGNDVAFPDSLHAWTTHGYYSKDGGVTWDTLIPPGYSSYYGISFPDTSHGWAVGEYGKIIHYGPKVGIGETGNKSQVTSNKLQVNPNPAIKEISIRYYVESNKPISLRIYGASGRLVETLVSGRRRAGYHTAIWKSKKTGVYFCQLEIEGRDVTKKVVVLK